MCNTFQTSVLSCSGVKATDRSFGGRSLRHNVHSPAERQHSLSARALVSAVSGCLETLVRARAEMGTVGVSVR